MKNRSITNFYSSLHQSLMISASKTTLRVNNLKILRPTVKKILSNLYKTFCEFPPGTFIEMAHIEYLNDVWKAIDKIFYLSAFFNAAATY